MRLVMFDVWASLGYICLPIAYRVGTLYINVPSRYNVIEAMPAHPPKSRCLTKCRASIDVYWHDSLATFGYQGEPNVPPAHVEWGIE